ncbi:hypothetical protein HK102_011369 [Quaeritorhiza haematococci]|nr:hypothetical protein HK102_011369 [Quaeritorhiza haematococci]
MGSKLALYGPVGVATAVGLLSGVFYAYVVTNKSFVTTLYSSAYWGVLALMWMICIWIKFTNLHFAITNAHHKQSDSEKHAPSLTSGLAGNKSLLFPALIVSGLCGLLSLLSFGGYLAARTPDKVAAIFVALNIINIAIFCWIHIQAASLNTTVASAIRKKKGALLYTLYIIIAAIASFFALLIHFGATIQAMGLAVDNVRFGTPPGVMVKLQDFPYSVHLFCTGRKLNASDPLIWIEHGLGGSMLDFSWVIANVSSYARVCSYDRPGLGWSDTGALPRTTPQFTKELQSLLRSADIKDDLFMVGHSMAGFNIRSAQRQLETNRVVGVVLYKNLVEKT